MKSSTPVCILQIQNCVWYNLCLLRMWPVVISTEGVTSTRVCAVLPCIWGMISRAEAQHDPMAGIMSWYPVVDMVQTHSASLSCRQTASIHVVGGKF